MIEEIVIKTKLRFRKQTINKCDKVVYTYYDFYNLSWFEATNFKIFRK